jgi:ribose transport system substrate-binding protein
MRRTTSFTLSTLVLLTLALLAPACGTKPTQPAGKVIGVSLLTRGHVFYQDLEEGLRQEAGADRFDLVVTAAEFDLGKQTAQIEDFVARKVDAIVLCPVDSKGVGPAIRKANAAGIPVFTADIAAQEGEVVSHIASDNVAGGRLAGEYLAKAMGGKGKVAIVNQPAITSVLDRVKGFRDAIAAQPGITVVADVNGQGVRDKSLEVTSDVLQAHPDLGGIFGINDDSALGALDAVRQFKRDSIVIVGYDATPSATFAISHGSPLRADVVQYPRTIGITTIATIRDHFSGATVPRMVPIRVGIVDKDTLPKAPAK